MFPTLNVLKLKGPSDPGVLELLPPYLMSTAGRIICGGLVILGYRAEMDAAAKAGMEVLALK
jgi:hypothetical protein